jgi:hypothetical protein
VRAFLTYFFVSVCAVYSPHVGKTIRATFRYSGQPPLYMAVDGLSANANVVKCERRLGSMRRRIILALGSWLGVMRSLKIRPARIAGELLVRTGSWR